MFALWYLNGGDFVQRAVERAAVNDGSGGCRVGLAADCHSVRLLQSGLTGKEPGNKKPSPFSKTLKKGRERLFKYSRGATLFVFPHPLRGKTTFRGYFPAWEPPTCSYLPGAIQNAKAFFGQPLTNAF